MIVDVEREGNMGNAQVCQKRNTASAFRTANAYSSAATALSHAAKARAHATAHRRSQANIQCVLTNIGA